MQDRAVLETFKKSSRYTSPQYIKRLKFIFSAICQYTQSKNKSIEDLEILEFGCSTGGITFPLTTLASHVTALDNDPSAVSVISERIQKENLNNVIVTQANGHSFDDSKSYDLVIASEVLEHVARPRDFYKESKPGLIKAPGWL